MVTNPSGGVTGESGDSRLRRATAPAQAGWSRRRTVGGDLRRDGGHLHRRPSRDRVAGTRGDSCRVGRSHPSHRRRRSRRIAPEFTATEVHQRRRSCDVPGAGVRPPEQPQHPPVQPRPGSHPRSESRSPARSARSPAPQGAALTQVATEVDGLPVNSIPSGPSPPSTGTSAGADSVRPDEPIRAPGPANTAPSGPRTPRSTDRETSPPPRGPRPGRHRRLGGLGRRFLRHRAGRTCPPPPRPNWSAAARGGPGRKRRAHSWPTSMTGTTPNAPAGPSCCLPQTADAGDPRGSPASVWVTSAG